MTENWEKIICELNMINKNEKKPFIYIINGKVFVIDEDKPFVEQIKATLDTNKNKGE